MTSEEIQVKIAENNKKIEEIMQPMIFTLNKEVVALMAENDALRAQCQHEFVNGVCKYCLKNEK